MTFRLSRRHVLRGVGAALALPSLQVMLDGSGLAFADGTPLPRRFITWFFGNGVIRSKWKPAQVGNTYTVSEQLAPLLAVRDYVSVISGFNVKTPNLRGHHNGAAALLSGAPMIPLDPGGAGYNSKFGMKSIDQVAADAIAGTTTFKSLQLAVSKRYTRGEGPTLANLSHRGPDAPMPQETNPARLFNTLFAGFTPKDPRDPRDAMRANVLDAVKDDAKTLQSRLGATDKQRLEAHLTGISELRTRVLALPPVFTSACVKPATPTQTNTDVGGIEPIEAVSSVMSDLLAMAFACDLTRVASFQFSGSVGGHCFKFLTPNEARDSEHSITHEATQQDKVNQAVIFTMKNFAYTLEALKRTLEGTGNVLDNTVALCTSDVAEGLDHSINDYPVLLAGKGGGALRSGHHFRSGTGRNTSDILLTAMRALGTNATSVGSASGLSTTPITELLV
ncbi:MAG: DUF1552 domain-containing protein [Archangium sp.]|nr:DUF1552 domain-containing protein [Archangium sp.]MDP3155894.1 DUF1552 domain-containing protein [Archangium sp.]MDP3574406.1 DUF1552 domain-containing protein [Archangium sp.]